MEMSVLDTTVPQHHMDLHTQTPCVEASARLGHAVIPANGQKVFVIGDQLLTNLPSGPAPIQIIGNS
jgi:hypothetical protein